MREPTGALRGLWSRPQTSFFGAALLALAAVYGFLKLADKLGDPELGGVDRWLLQQARSALVRSPDSVTAELAWNLTALGSYPVLVLLISLVTGFLLLHRAPLQALYVVGTTSGGALLTTWLKVVFERARPSEVQPLVHATGFSFPSGHALSSAVVYLTLGALLASNVAAGRTKAYVLSVCLLLTGLVGVSRVLLGVHYPSDVLAGWMAGLAWALLCWLGFELLLHRGMTMRGH